MLLKTAIVLRYWYDYDKATAPVASDINHIRYRQKQMQASKAMFDTTCIWTLYPHNDLLTVSQHSWSCSIQSTIQPITQTISISVMASPAVLLCEDMWLLRILHDIPGLRWSWTEAITDWIWYSRGCHVLLFL